MARDCKPVVSTSIDVLKISSALRVIISPLDAGRIGDEIDQPINLLCD